MMLSQEVKTADGQTKMVYADNEDDLKKAVSDLKGQKMPTYPNINHPVAKGHDLTETQSDMSTKLVDGTGAHNSPNDAVSDNGASGDELVLGMDEPTEKSQGDPGDVRPTESDSSPAPESK